LGTGLNQVTERIIGGAIEVHRELGPGLLESAYEACLFHELRTAGLKVARQVPLPIEYKGVSIECGKAAKSLDPIHRAQLLSYLKLAKRPLGLLINFNVPLLKNGIVRIANELRE